MDAGHIWEYARFKSLYDLCAQNCMISVRVIKWSRTFTCRSSHISTTRIWHLPWLSFGLPSGLDSPVKGSMMIGSSLFIMWCSQLSLLLFLGFLRRYVMCYSLLVLSNIWWQLSRHFFWLLCYSFFGYCYTSFVYLGRQCFPLQEISWVIQGRNKKYFLQMESCGYLGFLCNISIIGAVLFCNCFEYEGHEFIWQDVWPVGC